MPIQGLQFTIPSSQEAHQSYQSTGSFVVYNPNDGVAFVATDRTATGTNWDYKVPSQSGGRFPGPINSYLSIYYLDQSGSNTTAQVVVYASPESVNIPHFWSIGRALLTQSTSMDVVQGSQPANPGAGISRIWSDPTGNLHVLLPNGTDKVVLDSSNYSTYIALTIGDVVGPLNNNRVQLRNTSPIQAYDTGNTLRNLMGLWNDNRVLFWNAGNQYFQWLGQSGAPALMTLDASGNWSNAGTVTTGSSLTVTSNALYMTGVGQGPAAWLMSGGNLLSRMDGVWYFQNYAGSATRATLDTDGLFTATAVTANNNLTSGGNVIVNGGSIQIGADVIIQRWNPNQLRISSPGGLSLAGDATGGAGHGSLLLEGTGSGGNGPMVYWTNSGYWMTQYAAGLLTNGHTWYFWNNGGIYLDHNGSNWSMAGGGLGVAGSISGQGVGVGSYCFTAPNAAAAYGQGYANAWINASSKDFKKNIIPLANPLGILLNPALRGVEYDHEWNLEAVEGVRDPLTGTKHHIGFVADDWLPHVPEIVAVDATGKPEGMDYARVTTILWEALREYITQTEARLVKAGV